MYEDIPIKIYSMVHTMGKTAEGGLKAGLFNVIYTDVFPLNREDNAPTASGMSIEIINELLM